MKKKEIGELADGLCATAFAMRCEAEGDVPPSVTPEALRIASLAMAEAFATCSVLCGYEVLGDRADELGAKIRDRGDAFVLAHLLKSAVARFAEEQR